MAPKARRARRPRGTYKAAERTRAGARKRSRWEGYQPIMKPSGLGEPKAYVTGKDGEPELAARDYRYRPRRWRGAVANPLLELGSPPFTGINEERCRVCGEKVQDWRANVDWADGAALIRSASKSQGIPGGGYRTRGPVLWAMHLLKMQGWWTRHSMEGCRQLWDEFRHKVPLPRAVVWACFYGEPSDCALFYKLETALELGLQRPSSWPELLRVQVLELQANLDRPDDLERLEKLPIQDEAKTDQAIEDAAQLRDDELHRLLELGELWDSPEPITLEQLAAIELELENEPEPAEDFDWATGEYLEPVPF